MLNGLSVKSSHLVKTALKVFYDDLPLLVGGCNWPVLTMRSLVLLSSPHSLHVVLQNVGPWIPAVVRKVDSDKLLIVTVKWIIV